MFAALGFQVPRAVPVVFYLWPAFQAQPPPESNLPAESKPREYAPGVVMDWRHRTVEIEGVVVLRRGELELFACSARTREHESIMVIRARPLHVFQALGLSGLTPGSPVRYDEKENRRLPPTGDALELRVRYREGETEFVVPLEHWMVELQIRRPPQPLPWVFAGSRTSDEGRFAADIEGTIVAVVDFESSIMGLGTLHTADNAGLWLGARTEAIPPVGTKCVLLARPKPRNEREVRVALTADGKLRLDGSECSEADLFKRLTVEAPAVDRSILVVNVEKGVTQAVITRAQDALLRAGVDRASLEFRPPEPETPPPPAESESKPGG